MSSKNVAGPVGLLWLLVGCQPGEVPTPGQCGAARSSVAIEGPVITEDVDLVCSNVVYRVESDLRVEGATLTVGPGVTVVFGDDVEIAVGDGGSLVADGADAGITLTSADGVRLGWTGIVVEAGSGEAVFRNVTFENAGSIETGVVRDAAALRVDGQAEIVGSTFRGSFGYGVRFGEEGRATAFSNNTFEDNFAEMVFIYGNHVGSLDGPNRTSEGDAVRIAGDIIDTSAVWEDPGAAYRVVGDLLVEGTSSPVLELEAGVELRFDRQTGLTVGFGAPGSLVARGDDLQRVVLTSDQDEPRSGDWEGVQIDANAVTADLFRVDFRYGGDAQFDTSVATQAGLAIFGGEIALEECGFYDNPRFGLRIADGEVTSFVSNDFAGNGESPIRLAADVVGQLEGFNTFVDSDTIQIDAGTISRSATWRDLGTSYRVMGDLRVQGPDEPVLTLTPGVVLRMAQGASLVVGLDEPGELVAIGQSDVPVQLTSGTDRPPEPGDWGAIIFDRNGRGILDRVSIEYCGNETTIGSQPFEACVGIVGPARPTIQRSRIALSQAHGIELELGGNYTDTQAPSIDFELLGGDPVLID